MDANDSFTKGITTIKYTIASVVVVFYAVIIVIGLSGSYNVATFGGPLAEFLLLGSVLILLAYNEGFQVAVLGIEHLNMENIAEKGYHRTAKIYNLIYPRHGSKVKQLLIGQSFLVVLSSFIIANLTTFQDFPDIEGVNTIITDIFIRSGLPGAFVTICCAQLLPSMIAKEYPLQFLNIFGVFSIIHVALMIEKIGIVQFVYLLVQIIDYLWEPKKSGQSCRLFGPDLSSNSLTPINKMKIPSNIQNENNVDDSINKYIKKNHRKLISQNDDNDNDNDNDNEEMIWSNKMNPLHNDIYSNNNSNRNSSKDIEKVAKLNKYSEKEEHIEDKCYFIIEKLKYFLSTCLALSSLIFVILCMIKGYSSFEASVLCQFGLAATALFIVFYCEGLKVAIVSSSHLERDAKEFLAYPDALKIHDLLNERPDGVKRFLLGRQLIVVPLGFLVAQITHFNRYPTYNFSPALYFFTISLGLPGMFVLLQFSQLTPQLAAEANSLRFLSKRGIYQLTYIALSIEKLGLTSFSWVLYAIIEKVMRSKQEKDVKSGKNEKNNESETIEIKNEEAAYDKGHRSRNVSFSIITERENDIEDEYRSASTTGTTINPYIIRTPTYSV